VANPIAPAFEPHARADADGGDDPRDQRDPERDAAEGVGPYQPGEHGDEEGHGIEVGARVERLGGIEARLGVALAERFVESLGQVGAEE
jgi:hypothetical protein